MASLPTVYNGLKSCIVSIIPRYFTGDKSSQRPPSFPPIVGTGFIVADGLVATNAHVLEAIKRLPRLGRADEWPALALMLYEIPGRGIAEIFLEIIGVFELGELTPEKNYYGPKSPDFAFLHVKMKGLPRAKVHFDCDNVKEGVTVATAGFPMGTKTLMAPGYLHQITPTLQVGIVSAVLPFWCRNPHAILINIRSHPGASGSPVFLPESGEVVGVLYAGLVDRLLTSEVLRGEPSQDQEPEHRHAYMTDSNLSLVVPSHYLENVLGQIASDKPHEFPADTPSFDWLIANANYVDRDTATGDLPYEQVKTQSVSPQLGIRKESGSK